ncbi:MAG: cysteine desulfurase CsdA [Phycisphaeraceae bacterium]|nr:cysteine desulfurase CsdA [Phycisphaeraceae bacterium]
MSTTTPEITATDTRLDVEAIRRDFPILHQQVHGHPLVYLDSAATTQKPQCVIDAVVRYYREHNSNVHRGVHWLSEQATEDYEQARRTVQRFLGAADTREIVFVRGCTEAINLVAHSWGRSNLQAGDEILVSHMEHHSNIVPWQLLCEQTGAVLKVAPIDDDGALIFEQFERLVGDRTRLVAMVHVSNALGTINPVERVIERARAVGAKVLLDGAQATAHLKIDVQALGCDFYCLSGHKLYGPTGIGVLYGRRDLFEAMPPYQGGGDMIKSVSFEKTTWNDLPYKFEAGTPNIAGPIGLAEAIRYVEAIGLDRIAAHERDLLQYGTKLLEAVDGLRLIGTAPSKAGVLGFVLDDVHAHDVGTILDRQGVAIRTGHHCAQPVMERFGIPATARASLGVYNRREDLDVLAEALREVIDVFR